MMYETPADAFHSGHSSLLSEGVPAEATDMHHGKVSVNLRVNGKFLCKRALHTFILPYIIM